MPFESGILLSGSRAYPTRAELLVVVEAPAHTDLLLHGTT